MSSVDAVPATPSPRRLSRDAFPATPLLFLFFFALGLPFLAPSVTVGDSGEFVTAAATLAIAHPPGFPLFALGGKAFGTLAPFATWAWRTNLFSLAAAAAALALFFDLGLACGLGAAAAAFASLLLAGAPILATNALVTEVFSLNLLAGVAALRLLAFPAPLPRVAAAGGLLLGLASANHQTIVLILPAALYALGLRAGSRDRFLRVLGFAAAGFAAGFTVYLALAIRSAHGPLLDWGHPAGWTSAWRVILRQDYGSLALTVDKPIPRTAAMAWTQLARYAVALWSQWGPALALPVAGVFLWQSAALDLTTLGLFFLFTGPFFLLLGNPPMNPELEGALPRFYLLSLVPLALAAGAAARWLLARGRVAWALFALPVMLLLNGAPAWNARWDLLAYDYGRCVLRSLAPGAAFFIDGGDDTFYTLAYLHLAEGRRPDLEVHDRGGLVFANPYGPDFRRLGKDEKELRRTSVERAVAGARPLFYSTMNQDILPGIRMHPDGLVQSGKGRDLFPFYVLRAEAGPLAQYRYRALAPFPYYMKGLTAVESGRPGETGLQFGLALERGPDALWLKPNVAFTLGRYGWEASQHGDWASAEELYRWETRLLPGESPGWQNLGVSLEKLGRPRDAEAAELKSVQVNPDNADGWYSLGALYWSQRRWVDAAHAFSRVVALRPGDVAARSYLERASGRVGERAQQR